MVIVKCNKCGEQITLVNFQKGDTIQCPNCENNQMMRSIAWDTKIGASRSYLRGLMWTVALLFYSTVILYTVAEASFKIYNKQLTWGLACFWIICPICAYFTVKEKQEKREKEQEDLERRKDFNREMSGK